MKTILNAKLQYFFVCDEFNNNIQVTKKEDLKNDC